MPRINFVIRLQHWMDSVPGQTFLNYAYSWGASIVILGALFKLTHLPGGNVMLFLGMGTEVFVFFLSAFDRPFDKKEEGKELPPDYETDEQIASRLGISLDDDENVATEVNVKHPKATSATAIKQTAQQVAAPIIIGNISSPASAQAVNTVEATETVAETTENEALANETAQQTHREATVAAVAATVAPDIDAKRLAEIISAANDELLRRTQAVLAPEMEEATKVYIEKLKTLNETMAKVDDQNNRLMRDSEEMENLGRTLTGINKIYELQLKGISSQVGTIDDINEQTRHLAEQIQELNGVYSRMIKALTVNMKNAAGTVEE